MSRKKDLEKAAKLLKDGGRMIAEAKMLIFETDEYDTVTVSDEELHMFARLLSREIKHAKLEDTGREWDVIEIPGCSVCANWTGGEYDV